MELYIRDDCPFCQKVLRRTAELHLVSGRDFKIINAAQGTPGRAVVVKVGGKGQVPFLIDGEVKMYESDDIITYIEKKQRKPKA